MGKLDNITNELKKKAEHYEKSMLFSVQCHEYSVAAQFKAKKEAIDEAIFIVNTVF